MIAARSGGSHKTRVTIGKLFPSPHIGQFVSGLTHLVAARERRDRASRVYRGQRAVFGRHRAARLLLFADHVFHARSIWTRGLTFWEPTLDLPGDAVSLALSTEIPEGPSPYARSRFRSRTNPRRFAFYSMAEMPDPGSVLVRLGSDDHSLVVVREFRRVPLYAASLSLAVLTARPGRAAETVATLAHFVERAVSCWEPAYLMLARSDEQPCLSVLMAGVHDPRALAAGTPSTFSLVTVMPELRPMLAEEPEIFEYYRAERLEDMFALVAPRAV